jgi:tetratricopeptide (TPR) repeat protein
MSRDNIASELRKFDSTDNDTQNYIDEGKRYFNEKEYDASLYYYQLAHDSEPDNEMIVYNIGYILYLQHEYEESLSYFTLAVELRPDFEMAIKNRDTLIEKLDKLRKYVMVNMYG